MPKSVSYRTLEEFMNKSGLNDELEQAREEGYFSSDQEFEECRQRVENGSKNLIMYSGNGDLEKSLEIHEEMHRRRRNGEEIRFKKKPHPWSPDCN